MSESGLTHGLGSRTYCGFFCSAWMTRLSRLSCACVQSGRCYHLSITHSNTPSALSHLHNQWRHCGIRRKEAVTSSKRRATCLWPHSVEGGVHIQRLASSCHVGICDASAGGSRSERWVVCKVQCGTHER